MDFHDSPAEAEFRARLRPWLVDHNPGLPTSSTDDEYWARQAEWHTSLYDAGFFGLSWPARYGGQDLPPVFDVILDEELTAAGAPPRPSLGYLVQGFTVHASDEIKDRFLPGLISGRERWCQGFSEPDAGSDLASLRTTAVRDGDDYVIDGHKIWTSYSDVADWCFLLARTDPDVPKHKGLSAFAVPMHQPGIEQRPLRMINGITKEFGEVIFDEARVPAENMIGAPGEGWRLAMTIVSHEREPGELGYVARYAKTVKELEHAVRADPDLFRADQRESGRVGPRAERDAPVARLPAAVRAARRHRPRTRRVHRQAAHDLGRADCRRGRARGRGRGVRARRRRRRAQDLSLQPGPERHGWHLPDPEEHHRDPHSRLANRSAVDGLRLPAGDPRGNRRAGADRPPHVPEQLAQWAAGCPR